VSASPSVGTSTAPSGNACSATSIRTLLFDLIQRAASRRGISPHHLRQPGFVTLDRVQQIVFTRISHHQHSTSNQAPIRAAPESSRARK
jgi:hypothetical protein